MEAIIHPGMPKTGSSSIQATLVALKPEGWIIPDVKTGNMSGQFTLFFEDNPEVHRSFKARGLDPVAVALRREKEFEKFHITLKAAAEQGINTIFSAERISGSTEVAIQRIAEFYRSYGYRPRVIAYVRKPFSFMQSAFQQMVKTNLNSLDHSSLHWPNYRDRFEKLDRIFGRDNVQLSLFDQNSLLDGDVCKDFFSKIKVDISDDQVIRVNDSMSLTACALLYAQRNLGEGFVKGFKGAQVKNNAFIATISRIPGERLRFKSSFVAPMFERCREDLKWMEERLGLSLVDLPEEDAPDAIGSSEDLLAVADRHRDTLEKLLVEEITKEGDQPRDRLIRNLELLRKLHY